MSRYPSYSKTSVSWLGSIPEHWEIVPGYSVLAEKKEKNHGMTETTVLSLSYGRIVVKPADRLHGLVPESFETYQIVDKGNIIIRPTDLQNDKVSLRVGLSRDRGIITSAYICLEPNNRLLPDYAYNLLHAYDVMKIFYGLGSGLRQNLGFKDIKRLPIVVPHIEEQKRIVSFIQQQDRRIRKFIRNKKRLINLLEERLKIEYESVFSSIDKTCETKLGYHAEVLPGYAFESERYSTDPSDVPLLRGINVTPGAIRWDETVRWDRKEYERSRRFQLKEGDIVFGMDRPWISAGLRVAKIKTEDCPALLLQRVARIRTRPELDTDFLLFIMRQPHFQSHFESELTGVSVPHISGEQIKSYKFFLPSVAEQKQMIQHIEEVTLQCSHSIKKIRSEIKLIDEYRTRLIADAVTGQIDLRTFPLEGASTPELAYPSEGGCDSVSDLMGEGEEVIEEIAYAN